MMLKDLIPEQLYYIQVKNTGQYWKAIGTGLSSDLDEAHQFTGERLIQFFENRRRFMAEVSLNFIPVTSIQPEDIPY